jgi:imidazolonepropionase-like amidohydrolase
LSITSGKTIIKGENFVVIPGFIMSSDEPIEKLTEQGITTSVETNNPVAKQLPKYPDKGEISYNLISSFTAEAAKILNLKKKGLIDLDMSADILIFKSTDPNKLLINDLWYVIKNGQIVFKKNE